MLTIGSPVRVLETVHLRRGSRAHARTAVDKPVGTLTMGDIGDGRYGVEFVEEDSARAHRTVTMLFPLDHVQLADG